MGGGYKVYFSNSGAEAVEGAVKLAKYATERPAVIAFKGSFHGRTMMCTSLTASNSAYRKHYEGLVPSIYFFAEYPKLFGTPYKMQDGACPMEYFTQFDNMFKCLIDPYPVAAILMEPVQGEDGYVVPPREWVQYVRELCDKYNIMLIFDEVQTGFGRTGSMFAWQTHGVKPDIMSCAKGIANGLPLSAVVGKSEIMDKWVAGAHGGTFGANPVSCTAALATIDALDNGAIDNGRRMGEYFIGELKKLQRKYPCIGEVRGLDLMIGMELVYPDGSPNRELTGKIIALALERNLFLLACDCDKNVVCFIAPLTVTKEEIDTALTVLYQAVRAGHERGITREPHENRHCRLFGCAGARHRQGICIAAAGDPGRGDRVASVYRPGSVLPRNGGCGRPAHRLHPAGPGGARPDAVPQGHLDQCNRL